MLDHFQSFVQALLAISLLNYHLFPTDHRPSVNLWGHEMYAAASYLHTGFQSLPDSMHSAKNGNHGALAGGVGTAYTIVRHECWMNIDDAARELGQE